MNSLPDAGIARRNQPGWFDRVDSRERAITGYLNDEGSAACRSVGGETDEEAGAKHPDKEFKDV
ncbi:MAG: hypothetical protein H6993_12230 [Pseudomonadales bacterium]|nr:hypothetical protein [Pseudomonadales bacterium]MCP5184725.1 hypothetical protein [Pseudomonadales bacterium]